MDYSFYFLGVSFSIISGVINFSGTVMQKKVVNDHKNEPEFMKSLVKNPIWLTGTIMGFGIGTIFYMLAQIYIGPALIPGLMASGLIVLAFGSVMILKEKLKKEEIIAILTMILGIFLLGMSELSIDISSINLLEIGFLIRMITFTIALFLIISILEVVQRKNEKLRGIALAILSGCMFALSNLWISPLLGVIVRVLSGIFSLGELILFVVSCIILVLVNMLGIAKMQQAFKFGKAGNLSPIQQVPQQIVPIFIYFLIFFLVPPSEFSAIFLLIGITLILLSSFILGKRQAQMEELK
ncbi:MAG: hypothetical protein ACTSRI_01765 [Promethearchaeota archaeon]